MTKVNRYQRPSEFDLQDVLRLRYSTDFGTGTSMRPGAVDGLSRVASGIAQSKEREIYRVHPVPNREEMAAALGLADEARERAVGRVLHDELTVILGALDAGLSWREVGIALGHTEDTAEKAAKARHAWLRKRFPGYSGPYYETSTYDGPATG